MIKIFTTLSAVLLGMLAQAQNAKPISTFENIEITGNVKLVFTQTDESSVKTDHPQMNTYIKGNTLFINPTNPNLGATVYVSSKTLRSLKATNADVQLANVLHTPKLTVTLAGDATMAGNIESADQFALEISGTGMFNSKVETAELSAKLTDAARMCLTGHAGKSAVKATGGTLVSARNFQSAQWQVDARDLATVQVHAPTAIDIKVAQKARVIYTGKLASVKMNDNAIAVGDLKNAAGAVAGN